MSIQEVRQDPFDPEEFVERLAWRTTGGVIRNKPADFDPVTMHAAFERTIRELKDMNVQIQQQVEKLEAACKEEEKAHWQRVGELQKHNQAAFAHFQELDERINFVATKVVHLGDQLEGVNTPRARAAEAQLLMKYFTEFLDDGPPQSDIFTDPFRLQIAADIIQKLYLIAQELPTGPQFDKARESISAKYDQIERNLIEEFRQAQYEGDKKKMRRITNVLSHFKGYNQCIEAFIEESQRNAFVRHDVFEDIPPLCARTNSLICEVFNNPEMVMSKFVLNIYHGKLSEHIRITLGETVDLEKYLQGLFNLYSKTIKMSQHLASYKMSNDAGFLTKVTRTIFQRYLDRYVHDESKFLNEKSSNILQRYYDSKSHQKKQITSGGIRGHEIRREIQAVIGAKANLNLGPTILNYGGETFLSQEVAINLLQESKQAFKRCQVLSSRSELPNHSARIFDVLVQYLCMEHIDYALELGLQAIPLSDPKTEPEIYFFDVVGQANTMFHLFEKQFSDNLLPLVSGSPKHTECLGKKRDVMETMENKLDMGLDRTLTAMMGYVKYLLQTEQKKSDFKPEDEEATLQMFSGACSKVVRYINSQIDNIRFGLDGKNVEAVLTELGIRFHRVIYDHLLQYQYNSMGAMLAICDVNEYRKCVKEFQVPMVSQLFDTLHGLCNLLVVVPDNLKQVCTGEQLAGLDKSVLLSFVQLRADYKTARLVNHFK